MKPIAGAINADPNPERWAWADLACDAHALPFADGCLDSVVSNHVVPHLHNPLGALREMARVLKPGGVMSHVIPDLRYAPRRIEPMYPFAHQHHVWEGPLAFGLDVMSKLCGLFGMVWLEDFMEFRWSFNVMAIRL